MAKGKKTNQPTNNKQPQVDSKARNTHLDVLKGFAILLVVLGHSTQTFVANGRFDENLLFNAIYSFHMPLFMFLSGAVAAYSLRPMNMSFLKRKATILVIPFIAWYVVGFFIGGAYHTLAFDDYMFRVVQSPGWGLWFLWVLFLCFCCLALAKLISSRAGLGSYLIVWVAVYILPIGAFGVGLLQWHLPFFFTGYLIFIYRERLMRFRTPVLLAGTLGFLCLVGSWHREAIPYHVVSLQAHLVSHNLAIIKLGDLATLDTRYALELFYKYLVPFCGIAFTFWIFSMLKNKHIYALLGFLGIYTLDIYAVNIYFLRFAVGSSWVAIISGFILSVILSVALGFFVLRRVPLLNKIFLGNR